MAPLTEPVPFLRAGVLILGRLTTTEITHLQSNDRGIFCLTCDRLLRKDCAVNYLVCRLTGRSELKGEAVELSTGAPSPTLVSPVVHEKGTRTRRR